MEFKGDLMSKTQTRTIFAFFLFTILFALLSACGGGSDKDSDSSGSGDKKDPIDKEGPASAPTATGPTDPISGASYDLSIVCNEKGEVVTITGEGLDPESQTHTCTSSGAEDFSLSIKQEVSFPSPNNLSLSSEDEHGNPSGKTTMVDVPIDTLPWKVSIDSDSLSDIDSSNAQSFELEGTCTENGQDVVVSVGGVTPETSPVCDNGLWSLTGLTGLDVTGLNKTTGQISITADHSSSGGDAAAQALETVANNFICPENFVGVPSLTGYTTNSFCVMKYEAKNDGSNNAISQAADTPWGNINRANSITRCQAIGTGYDLITNDEWQSIARNIEDVSSNWATGTIENSGGLNIGHSDTNPASTLKADSDDNNACHETGQTCDATIWNSQRRTHTLSNGEVVWDMSGNADEWVKDDSATDYGSQAFMSEITDITHSTSGSFSGGTTTTSRTAKGQFGPSRDYTGLNSDPWGGLGYGFFGTGNSITRGGEFLSFQSGIFRVSNGNTSVTNPALGFRCTYHP